jgi:hypothetical protein
VVLLGKYKTNVDLDTNDKNIIENADVLILQVIENDRGFLNNDKINEKCKKDFMIIKIPHYRNSIYEYKTLEGFTNKYGVINNWKLPSKIKNLDDIDGTIEIIQNEIDIMNNHSYDKNEMYKAHEFKYNEFQKVDELSDIKMLDYYQTNYKKRRLFQSRSYPSSIFFYELTNRIMKKLNIKPNENFIDLYFAENTSEPMPEYWYKYCEFEFENIHHVYGHLKVKEYEWYYILLLSNDINVIKIEQNMNYINKIRKIV